MLNFQKYIIQEQVFGLSNDQQKAAMIIMKFVIHVILLAQALSTFVNYVSFICYVFREVEKVIQTATFYLMAVIIMQA